jgi:hypothetical protein
VKVTSFNYPVSLSIDRFDGCHLFSVHLFSVLELQHQGGDEQRDQSEVPFMLDTLFLDFGGAGVDSWAKN